MAACRVNWSIRTITGSGDGGNASCARSLPEMTANQTPSRIWSSAVWAANAAARTPSAPIEPDVSTMMISPASPLPDWPADPRPLQDTVTIACTSVPPSGRNSFWYTVAENSAISGVLSVELLRYARVQR